LNAIFLYYLYSLVLLAGPQDLSPADTLLVAGHVLTMDESWTVHSPGAVAVKDGVVAAVGPEAVVRGRFAARATIEARDAVLLPGLVNAHTHAPMTLFRGFADGLPLEAWLTTKIFPAESCGVTEESVRCGTRVALAEMARTGTTTFCDMYYFEDVVAEETIRAGLRGVLGSTVIGFPVPDAPDVAAALARAERFLEAHATSPLVVPAVAPHSTYTLDVETLKRCRALADRFGAPLLIHLSETKAEVEDVRTRFGRTPIAHAESIGLFSGGRTVAAHCVHPTAEEIAILARRGVGVGHCPESNMKLGSGVAPVPALLRAGVAVGLGTDGAASNDDLDLFEEIDTAAKLQKVAALDPTALDARAAVAMATIGGARALGLGERIGSIEEGKAADLVLLGGSGRAGLVPMGDPYSFVAYVAKGSDVKLTMVAGRVVYRDGETTTVDVAAAARDAVRWRERIEAAMSSSGGAEARIDVTWTGGFAPHVESRLVASSRGFVVRLTRGGPSGDVWEKFGADGAAIRALAEKLRTSGFEALGGKLSRPKDMVVMDAPSESWRLLIGSTTAGLEVEPGGQLGAGYPAWLRETRDALSKLAMGTPAERGEGDPPADLGVDLAGSR